MSKSINLHVDKSQDKGNLMIFLTKYVFVEINIEKNHFAPFSYLWTSKGQLIIYRTGGTEEKRYSCNVFSLPPLETSRILKAPSKKQIKKIYLEF